MGWCYRTDIFDVACGAILNPNNVSTKDTLKGVLLVISIDVGGR
jgi:hypothetical protein